MNLVTLKHPDLSDGQTISVDVRSLPHYQRSGWLRVDVKVSVRRKNEDK